VSNSRRVSGNVGLASKLPMGTHLILRLLKIQEESPKKWDYKLNTKAHKPTENNVWTIFLVIFVKGILFFFPQRAPFQETHQCSLHRDISELQIVEPSLSEMWRNKYSLEYFVYWTCEYSLRKQAIMLILKLRSLIHLHWG
jgi:hypothetical protein